MSGLQPFVTIIIPCRNEERYIRKVLENISVQDYPDHLTEVIVMDGMSTDLTANIVSEFAKLHPYISILENPFRVVPHALNLAIRNARGEIIVRMDAHAEYPENYISSLVKYLNHLNADNVGGVWITMPGDATLMAKAIAYATSHPFGIGNALYKLGGDKPIETDTVPFGCYRREIFNKIGLFDEDLIRNQDDEFNARLKKKGGKIYLIPDIKIKYYARPTLKRTASMFYQYGLFKPLVNSKIGYPATLRQLAPPSMIIGLSCLLFLSVFSSQAFVLLKIFAGIYFFSALIVALLIAVNKNNLKVFFPLLVIFPIIHFSYGWGYLHGILKFNCLRAHERKILKQIESSR
jgi:glycosyltransferase involved in cell wall biosynthesis